MSVRVYVRGKGNGGEEKEEDGSHYLKTRTPHNDVGNEPNQKTNLENRYLPG